MKKGCAAILILLLLLTLGPVTQAEAQPSEFVVLVYLCGTDLETRYGAATDDMIEIVNAGLPGDGSVAVLIQTGGTAKWQNEVVDESTSQRYLVTDDLYILDEDLGQLDMGDPDTLRDFLLYARDAFPAKRYGLVLWDHGSGATGGVCYDERTGHSLSAESLSGALKEAGVRLDFIGFDACLMASFEMANHMKFYADYMIASEELEPSCGWAYDQWLRALARHPSMPTETLCTFIVDSFIDTALSKDPNEYVTLSAIDLTAIDALSDAVNRFGEALGGALRGGDFRSLSRARAGMRSFGDYADSSSDMVDLASVANGYAHIAPAESQVLLQAVNAAVSYTRNSANIESACGLSILMPDKTVERSDAYMPNYDPLQLMPGYTDFVINYLQMLLGGDYIFHVDPLTQTPIDVTDAATQSWFGNFIQSQQPSAASGFHWASLWDSIDVDEPEAQTWSEIASAFGGSAYTLELSPSDLDNLSYAEAALFEDASGYLGDIYGEDVYFDLGLTQDVYVDWDSGKVYGLFDGTWPTLDGQVVVMYDQIVSERYARSIIPATVNGVDQYVSIVFTDEHPGGFVAGYSEGYDENGNPARGNQAFQPGDEIIPLYDLVYWDQEDEMQIEVYEGQPIVVGDDLPIFQYEVLDEGDYYYALCLNDVYGGYQFTDFKLMDR